MKVRSSKSLNNMAGATRLELAISGLTGQCVNQLHHAPAWWAGQGLNLRPPACKADALPTELPAQFSFLPANLRSVKKILYQTLTQIFI